MNKLLLILILIILSFTGFGQDYQNICSPGITLYRNPSNSFGAFRQDSVIPAGSNDTIYISYRAIRSGSNPNCFDTTGGSVLGRKVYRKGNGWFWFFNRFNDTVKVNTQAVLNQTWRFCPLPANAYIQAQVTGIITDSVLGMTDDIKIISFQAKDASNNNISHPLNQKFIKLSRNYGLSRMLDVFSIPNDTTFLTLAGKTNPLVGVQNLTWKEIYNFNVGDEFHYTGSATDQGWRDINKIMGRTDYGNDSVVYTIEECQQHYTASPPYYYTVHDTVTAVYSYNPSSGWWIPKMPGEFHSDYTWADGYWFEEHSFPGRRLKGYSEGAYFKYSYYDTCWQQNIGYQMVSSSWSYTEGLGLTSQHYQDFDPPYSQHMDQSLVYYKKGSETWGTPIAPDCSVLLGDGQNNKNVEGYNIEVVPNPFVDNAQVIMHGLPSSDDLTYVLYNYSGVIVRRGNIPGMTFTVDRQGLPSGLYILLISGDEGIIKAKARIMVY
jgi:hypothetical protein